MVIELKEQLFTNHIPEDRSFFLSLTEPYNYFGRRGRKEPEALAAASLKRLFVENQPYLVGGYCQNGLSGNTLPSIRVIGSKFSFSLHRDAPNFLSMADKYKHMKETFRKRLAFGKWISISMNSHELMIYYYEQQLGISDR